MAGSPHRPSLSQPRRASGSLRQTWPWREGLYYGALAPASPLQFTTFSPQENVRDGVFYFTPKFPFLITRLSFWLGQLGNSPPSGVQKHVGAISHSIKIYLLSKHGDKLIQSWDLNIRLAVPLQIPALICDTRRIYISALQTLSGQYMTNKGRSELLPPLHMTSTGISHVLLPHWMGLDFFFFFFYLHKHDAS